ncbi:type II toxin-antitoxin system HicB family antitoxin [Lyngbya confervoides]|uniref:Type II toxin-antitoxin system HicB family antitoxin n=1 Tax=Lyngbya confervoides BDU141951 TaxID=1574623 RepID=A0ABD4T1E5_9CYAN|nr:type II toxin-antitoxin system HicB family antitoxin [Lyngbya confervoides]MCM1982180.1 type II toxin-antitoxin system HicB family antitoxin [Lyngbya confervoides BDU141951]
MLNDYLHAAMQRAQYQICGEEEGVRGEIPGFDKVTAYSDTLETCQKELLEALEEWVFFRFSRKLPLPVLDGIELAHYEVH